MQDDNVDKGGHTHLAKRWSIHYYLIEVAVEDEKETEIEEREETAADFMNMLARAMARDGNAFCSVTKISECGATPPAGLPIVFKTDPPSGRPLKLPKNVQTTYEPRPPTKPKKAKKRR